MIEYMIFHLELRELNIKHLFFNTYPYFDVIEEQKDWHGQFIILQ